MTFILGRSRIISFLYSRTPCRVGGQVMGAAGAAPATKPVAPAVVAGLDARDKSERATVAALRSYRMKTAKGNLRVLRGEFHRHSELSMDGHNDVTLIDQYRYMIDASYMDWVGCCDHDKGGGREYPWWISQKLTDLFHSSIIIHESVGD